MLDLLSKWHNYAQLMLFSQVHTSEFLFPPFFPYRFIFPFFPPTTTTSTSTPSFICSYYVWHLFLPPAERTLALLVSFRSFQNLTPCGSLAVISFLYYLFSWIFLLYFWQRASMETLKNIFLSFPEHLIIIFTYNMAALLLYTCDCSSFIILLVYYLLHAHTDPCMHPDTDPWHSNWFWSTKFL